MVLIVAPFHNEESNVTALYDRSHAVMDGMDRDYQFVFMDDGSTDLTYKLLKEVAMMDPRVTIVRPVCAQPPYLIVALSDHDLP